MKKSLFYIISCLGIIIFFGCSKYGEIEGLVINKLSEKPIIGATVIIKGTALSTITDEHGHFAIKDIVPGMQKIVVSKDGYLSAGELEITTAKGTTVQATKIYLIPKPPEPGLYSVSDTLLPIHNVSESKWGKDSKGNFFLNESKAPKVNIIGKDINMILYEGDNPPKTINLYVFLMKYSPARTAKLGSGLFAINIPYPASWEIQKNISEGIQIEKFGKGLSQIKGHLQSSRYCIRLQHEPGVKDYFYIFDVEGKEVEERDIRIEAEKRALNEKLEAARLAHKKQIEAKRVARAKKQEAEKAERVARAKRQKAERVARAKRQEGKRAFKEGYEFFKRGLYVQAVAEYEKAWKLGNLNALNGLAWHFAACKDSKQHDGKRAVELALELTKLKREKNELDTLAAAYARNGQFEEAVNTQVRALSFGSIRGGEERLKLYRQGRPYQDK